MVIKNKRLAIILVVVGTIAGAALAVIAFSTVEFKITSGFTGALCGAAIGWVLYILYEIVTE